MDKDSTEFTLPPAPRGICFDRNDFIKTNFTVDNFLEDHQNVASLETMRDDLGVYLKVLRLAMIELINKDYANFVNLSATLIGFDKEIVKIQVPLGQLNEEVLSVKQCLEDAMKELSMWLNQRHGLLKKKQLLKYYGQTINCLKILENILNSITEKNNFGQEAMADRAAMQYNHLKFSISKCDSIVKPEQRSQFNDIGGKLVNILNDLLFQAWNKDDEDNLLKVLMTLITLDRVSETEMLIRKQAISPLLIDIINEPALQKSKEGLTGIYERVLSLLDTKLKLLISTMQHSKLAFLSKKYSFLVNCFWCEIENRLEVNLASIFAPGNPKIFYTRYSESMKFIKNIEEYCTDDDMVEQLHSTPEFKSFQRRWNLPVYFQIRFQEIAGGYESCLEKSPTLENNEGFILKETYKCWKALQECWSEGIYIEELAHKFWKLSLQLLSRYTSWSTACCAQDSSVPKIDPPSINKGLIDNSINIYIDSQTLLHKLPNFLRIVESKIHDSKDLFRPSLRVSEEALINIKDNVCTCIVKELFECFNTQLKQVNEIPRLYRKTNRNVPTKPCMYLEVMGKCLKDFNEDTSKKLDNSFVIELYGTLFNTLTVSYYKYVEDVLTSVQKTEESLRRLKRIREMGTQQINETSGITDDDKIRLQLKVDVTFYGRLAESVLVNLQSVHKYNELYSMVTDAIKNIDIK